MYLTIQKLFKIQKNKSKLSIDSIVCLAISKRWPSIEPEVSRRIIKFLGIVAASTYHSVFLKFTKIIF